MSLPSTNFINPYQTETVNAGETKTIFLLEVPESLVGFINEVANSWFPNTVIKWYIDGELFKTVEYEMGDVNNPKKVKPPILAKREIKFVAINNDGVAHTFEVLCDGELYLKGEIEDG